MPHARSPRVLTLLTLLALTSCRDRATADSGPASPDAPALTLRVVAEREGQSFRYLDPASGAYRTALRRDDVPEAARALVTMHDEALPPEAIGAGEAIVVDLREADGQGVFPARVVSLVQMRARARADGQTKEAHAQGAPAPPAGEVLLFVTSWCPHCRRAEAWLRGRGVPFQKLDVETRPGARELLAKVLADNQIPADMGSSVPIVVVRGKALIGFDEAAVARLLDAPRAP